MTSAAREWVWLLRRLRRAGWRHQTRRRLADGLCGCGCEGAGNYEHIWERRDTDGAERITAYWDIDAGKLAGFVSWWPIDVGDEECVSAPAATVLRLGPHAAAQMLTAVGVLRSRPHVAVDPGMKFGEPTIGGTGIAVDVVAGMVWAGETVDTVAWEYSGSGWTVTREQVLVACWFVATHGNSRRWRKRWKAWAEQAHQHMHAGDWDKVVDPPKGDTDA